MSNATEKPPEAQPLLAITPENFRGLLKAAAGINDDKTPIEPLLVDARGVACPPFPFVGVKAKLDKRQGPDDIIID